MGKRTENLGNKIKISSNGEEYQAYTPLPRGVKAPIQEEQLICTWQLEQLTLLLALLLVILGLGQR